MDKDQEIKEMEIKLQETSQKNQELEEKLKVLNKRIITSSLATSLLDAPKNRRETWGGHLCRPHRQSNSVGGLSCCIILTSSLIWTLVMLNVLWPSRRVFFRLRRCLQCSVLS